MPEYTKVIAVDGVDFNHILQTFSGLVHDKFHKPIPYRDYTQLKKYHGEVEFRFSPSDSAVMAVPTESGKSLLWWGKKDDESFGAFLWDYFQEELKEMHPDENKKINNPYEYDLWGSYNAIVDANCSVSAKSTIDTKDYWSLATKADNDSTSATIAGDYSINAATVNGWTNISDTVEQLKARVEELGKMVNDNTADLHKRVQEVARTSTKSLEEAYEEMEARLASKVDISEMKYHLDDCMMDVLAEVDETRYDTKELADRVRELEDNLRPKQEEETAKVICYDVNGVAHEVPATMRGTSSNCYPVKNYKIKADYMSAPDNRKEKENMDMNKMFNGFEFGPVDDRIKMSPYGMAIRNADGRYVSYDAKTSNIVDVEVFNFENHKLIWKMPVAVSAIAVGDTVIHMKKPMFVTNVTNGITVIDIFNGEVKTIVPAQNMFGFNFITKVVSLFNFTGDNTPSAENPFGNIMPFMLMGNEDMDMKDFFMMMAVANGGNMNTMFQNPLMFYALMKDSDGVGDVLPFLMMGQNGLFGAPAHTCNCGGHCNGENHQ